MLETLFLTPRRLTRRKKQCFQFPKTQQITRYNVSSFPERDKMQDTTFLRPNDATRSKKQRF